MLFVPGKRPPADAVAALGSACGAYSVSVSPDAAGAAGEHWLELLANGLTFELAGLRPGGGHGFAPSVHRVGPARDFVEAGLEAVQLRPGPHLSGGTTMLPILRALAVLTARLTELPGCVAVIWHPARCLSDSRQFRNAVLRWSDGGAFPGLGLVALVSEPGGALLSEGLHPFVGQELSIEAELAADREAATRLALLLMQRLVGSAELPMPERLETIADFDVECELSEDRRLIRVWRPG